MNFKTETVSSLFQHTAISTNKNTILYQSHSHTTVSWGRTNYQGKWNDNIRV